jgi:hypothetical protein
MKMPTSSSVGELTASRVHLFVIIHYLYVTTSIILESDMSYNVLYTGYSPGHEKTSLSGWILLLLL